MVQTCVGHDMKTIDHVSTFQRGTQRLMCSIKSSNWSRFAVQRRDQGLRPSKETQDETKEKQYRRNKNNRRLYLYRTFALSIANESSHRGQLNSMYMHICIYIYIFFWNLRESLKFLTVPGTPYYFYIYIYIYLESLVPIVSGTFQSARNFGHWRVYHLRSRISTGIDGIYGYLRHFYGHFCSKR